MRNRLYRRALLVLPTAAVVLAAGAGVVPAGASVVPRAGLGWRTVKIVALPAMNSSLLTVTSPKPAQAWAFGIESIVSPPNEYPLVMRWNGHHWSQVPMGGAIVSALGTMPVLVASNASGPGNVWAFTIFGNWLHGNGITWTAASLPTLNLIIGAAFATGPASAWAFGGASASQGLAPYAAFGNGSVWTRTPVPGSGMIAGASAVSSRDIWAVLGKGFDGVFDSAPAPAGLVHWTGAAWHAVKGLPRVLRHATLGSVLARSDKNIWVGGGAKNASGGTTEVVGHWNGHTWTVAKLRAPATSAEFRVTSIVSDGSGGVWALGTCADQGCSPSVVSRLWHEVRGRWHGPIKPKLASQPNVLAGLSSTGSSVWGVGAVTTGSAGVNALIAVWGRLP